MTTGRPTSCSNTTPTVCLGDVRNSLTEAPASLVVDTSAAVAVLFDETGAASLLSHLSAPDLRLMTSANFVELGIIVAARLGDGSSDVARRLVFDADIEIQPVDVSLAELAIAAWRRFGNGRHPAALNYGDCFSYALAAMTGLPILCTGAELAATDRTVITPTQ